MQQKEDIAGKYARRGNKEAHLPWRIPVWVLPFSFFLIECFSFAVLSTLGDDSVWEVLRQNGLAAQDVGSLNLWPLAFGIVWATLLTGIVRLIPGIAGRIAYGVF